MKVFGAGQGRESHTGPDLHKRPLIDMLETDGLIALAAKRPELFGTG
ncbi:hypothetical protein [Streptomyces rugosispiralis]|uniref:Uncharacterized protein n=1 Tax=Streptomyces rugosispiralis TaxID=2967341 RepID=A0ABT1V5F2_9ACTN|nr:hypothetical protein [Streptomyces rugosispiralis]MCQ8192609.1 hypothetical protein [Streptomyces rugosispiralis]